MTQNIPDIQEQIAHFHELCHRHNLNITPQRIAVFKALIVSDSHPSATAVHHVVQAEFPNISLDTVNRTLLTFHRVGLIKVVESSGDPKRFDTNPVPHHHFRCVSCGRIVDFVNPAYDAIAVPEEISRRFEVREKKVVLEGLCDVCGSGAAPGVE